MFLSFSVQVLREESKIDRKDFCRRYGSVLSNSYWMFLSYIIQIWNLPMKYTYDELQ